MIYNLRRIRKFLDKDSTKTIVHACSKLLQWVIVWDPWLSNRETAAGSKHLCKIDLWLFKILTDYSTVKGSALVTSTPENIIQILADRI